MILDRLLGGTTAGFRTALRQVRQEWELARMHRRSVARAQRNGQARDLKLNIGCGRKVRPGWVNIDLVAAADLQLDLREPLPFPDGSVGIVYSEHFFEHLEYPDEARGFLRESLRVLEPGGVFSVGVPDTEWPLRCYATDDDAYFKVAREEWHPAWCDTRMHSINYHFRQGVEHKYAYDEETLTRVLEQAGFVQVRRRPFDPELDHEMRRRGTLYMDARKPIA
jgi:predicted SAM-dependent methyltransferase